MPEIIEPTIEEQPGERLSWSKVWISVITRPSVATFERILRDPQARARRAYLWLFISIIVSVLISGGYSTLGLDSGLAGLGFVIICSPVIALAGISGIMLQVGVTQLIAGRVFRGSGTFERLIYATAAFMVPTLLISSLIGLIPYVEWLAYPLYIYQIVLGVIAVKAVNRIGGGQSFISYITFPVVAFGIAFVLTICVLTILGPSIGDAFQNVIQDPGFIVP